MELPGYPVCDIGCHLDRLHADGEALAAAAGRAGLNTPVPACPGWQVRDLLGHLGYVHRWAAGFVREQITDPVPTLPEAEMVNAAPAGDSLLGWFRAGHAALVSVLAAADPAVNCWTFLPAPSPLRFWARRQAHETAIHRADAEQAAGGGVAFPPAFAADGIDELLTGFLARNARRGGWHGRPGTLGIHAEDGPAGQADWRVVTDAAGGAQVSRGSGPAGCDVTGPASVLYQALWNRAGADGLAVTGDASLLTDFGEHLQVTWR